MMGSYFINKGDYMENIVNDYSYRRDGKSEWQIFT